MTDSLTYTKIPLIFPLDLIYAAVVLGGSLCQAFWKMTLHIAPLPALMAIFLAFDLPDRNGSPQDMILEWRELVMSEVFI